MKAICSFNGCNGVASRTGLCAAHYKQKCKGKELKPLQVQHHGLTEEQRFMKRVEKKGPKDCWNWTGAQIKKDWHGEWRSKAGKIELAHRAAFRMFKCEIPEGMFVLHKCDNPICVNPQHLFLGTQSDNLKDMWSKGRGKPTPLFGEEHGMSLLTKDAVLDIRSSTESGVALARKYGVSPRTICDVRKRRTWKHI